MPQPISHHCDAAPRLLLPCSGAADVGELADQTARELTRRGTGKMFCLAGIGGRVSGLVAAARAAGALLTLDGCPVACARKTLEQAGFEGFASLEITSLGFPKGQTPVTADAIREVAEKAAAALAQAPSR